MADIVETHWNSSSSPQWVDCDITQLGGILTNEEALQDRVNSLQKEKEISYRHQQRPEQFTYPELMSSGGESVGNVISNLMHGIVNTASVVGITPCALLNDR